MSLIDTVHKICHILKLPISAFEQASFLTHRISNFIEKSALQNNEPTKITEIYKSFATAIVWITLQNEEVVSADQYSKRDVIHAVWDFCSNSNQSVKKVDDDEEEPDDKNSKNYNEQNYQHRVFQLEKQEMYILRLLNFDFYPIDTLYPSTILHHWSKSLFDHRYRNENEKIQKFNTLLFTLYQDCLKIPHLWQFKSEVKIKEEEGSLVQNKAKSNNRNHKILSEIGDKTGPSIQQLRRNCMGLFYVTFQALKTDFPLLKFANFSFFAPEVKMIEIEAVAMQIDRILFS